MAVSHKDMSILVEFSENRVKDLLFYYLMLLLYQNNENEDKKNSQKQGWGVCIQSNVSLSWKFECKPNIFLCLSQLTPVLHTLTVLVKLPHLNHYLLIVDTSACDNATKSLEVKTDDG